MDDKYPSEKKFLATQLSEEEKQKYQRLSIYADVRDYGDVNWEVLQSKQTEWSKLNKELEILIAQEKPKSVESEEATVRYWEQQLSDYQQKGSGEQYLLDQLKALEASYRAKVADIESKLQACRQNHHGKESFFSHRLQAAKQILDDRRNHKSAPRIKLEMKLAEPKKYIDDYHRRTKGKEDWDIFSKELRERKSIWTDSEWKRLDAEDASKKAAKVALPTLKVVMKQPKVVMKRTQTVTAICEEVLYSSIIEPALQTLCKASGLAEHSSAVASERATTEPSAQDPQRPLV
jgi:hypothetical protein